MTLYFFGDDVTRKKVESRDLTFEQFVTTLPWHNIGASLEFVDAQDDKIKEHLKNGPYFTPCQFAGNVRSLDVTTKINLVCLDIDNAPSFINWQALNGLRWFWYETFKSRPGAPRYRVAVDAEEIPVDRYGDAVRFLAGLLGVQPDACSTSAVQPMYTPRIYTDYVPQWGYALDGYPLHGAALPEPEIIPDSDTASVGDNPFTVEDVADMLSYLDPDCSRKDWIIVAMGLKHAFGDAAFPMFDEWSKGSKEKYTPRETWYQFNNVKSEAAAGRKSVTLGSVVSLAMKSGYSPTAILARTFFSNSVAVVPAKVNGHGEMGEGLGIGSGWEFFHVGFPETKTSGKPKGTYMNFRHLLQKAGIVCRYNLMSKREEISIPGTAFPIDNADNNYLTLLTSLAHQVDFPVGSIAEYVSIAASENAYHPALNWIDSKPWDGVDRLMPLVQSLDSTDPVLSHILLQKWMVTAVRALLEPDGISAQGMVVLQGPQNAGKTTWFKALLGNNQHFGKEGATLNPTDKDSVSQVISYWIVELGEIDATFKRAEISELKKFISKSSDELRMPYARKASTFPRKTVFMGTVNPDYFLHDPTGNRRYWTIKIGANFNAHHGIDAQQLWAQVKQCWLDLPVYLSPAENALLASHNEAFEGTNAEYELFTRKYDSQAPRVRQMTLTDILLEMELEPTRSNLNKWSQAVTKSLGTSAVLSGGRKLYAMPMPRSPFA